jgi:hypothetical protein
MTAQSWRRARCRARSRKAGENHARDGVEDGHDRFNQFRDEANHRRGDAEHKSDGNAERGREMMVPRLSIDLILCGSHGSRWTSPPILPNLIFGTHRSRH